MLNDFAGIAIFALAGMASYYFADVHLIGKFGLLH
ncbi:hypothetical protein AAUPMC_04099, partial [Pasteurella multocida subsp. multocida str. Anand1_cattle]